MKLYVLHSLVNEYFTEQSMPNASPSAINLVFASDNVNMNK